MFTRKTVPYLIALCLVGILITLKSAGFGNPPDKYQTIFEEVAQLLEEAHFSPRKIDDEFSKDIFGKYLSALDEDRNIFLQSDVRELRRYETRIDDELHGAEIQFFHAVDAIYRKRLKEVTTIPAEIMATPFAFSAEEAFLEDASKSDYPATPAARKDAWRKRLKYMTLVRYSDMLDAREQNKAAAGTKPKTDAELEKEARAKVASIMERNFQRLNSRFTEEERFNLLVNKITASMDPHTNFFPPVEKRSFDEQMSGRFYGIGASLRGEDGTIKVATLVTGMPAWKSGQIQVGDQILKVAQAAEEPVDVSGFEVEDAVKLIRGKLGTEVRVTIKKPDGTMKVVTMIREEIQLDETYARSAIIEGQGARIGYIFLPEFYADWERPNGARSAIDVAREIMKLKEQSVDGIIMDLRYNGGGSLYDVVQIAGYFITDGPVVQVKDRDGNPNVLRDRDRSVLYNGPLAVMVNQFSASASEIFAAAMQDYRRGVVVGGSSTFGKGTVQRNIGIDRATYLGASGGSELGSVKLTLQKFYRINGGSTQLKGVTPDIILPDQSEYLRYRERDDPDALQWDEIARVPYGLHTPSYDLERVRKASGERVGASPVFNAIKSSVALMDESREKEVSLNLARYRQHQRSIRDAIKRIDEGARKMDTLAVRILPQDRQRMEKEGDNKLERRNAWLKTLGRDVHLSETFRIMQDMLPVGGAVVQR